MPGRPSCARPLAMAWRTAVTHPVELSNVDPEQSLKKLGEGAMLAGGFPGGRMPSRGEAFVTGDGGAEGRAEGVADASGAGVATRRTRGSTVTPATAMSLRTWGRERR